MRSNQSNRLAVGLLAAAAAVGVLLWPALPADVAIHWNASGAPDTVVSKPVAVFGLPAFGVAVVAFTRLAPDSLTNTPGGEDATVVFVGAALAAVQGAVYAWNLGFEFAVGVVVAAVLVAAALLVWYDRGV